MLLSEKIYVIISDWAESFFRIIYILNCPIYNIIVGRILNSHGYLVNFISLLSNSCAQNKKMLIAQSKQLEQ